MNSKLKNCICIVLFLITLSILWLNCLFEYSILALIFYGFFASKKVFIFMLGFFVIVWYFELPISRYLISKIDFTTEPEIVSEKSKIANNARKRYEDERLKNMDKGNQEDKLKNERKGEDVYLGDCLKDGLKNGLNINANFNDKSSKVSKKKEEQGFETLFD